MQFTPFKGQEDKLCVEVLTNSGAINVKMKDLGESKFPTDLNGRAKSVLR